MIESRSYLQIQRHLICSHGTSLRHRWLASAGKIQITDISILTSAFRMAVFLLPKSHILFLGVLLVFMTIVMSILNKLLLYEPLLGIGCLIWLGYQALLKCISHQSCMELLPGGLLYRFFSTFLRSCNEALG